MNEQERLEEISLLLKILMIGLALLALGVFLLW